MEVLKIDPDILDSVIEELLDDKIDFEINYKFSIPVMQFILLSLDSARIVKTDPVNNVAISFLELGRRYERKIMSDRVCENLEKL